MKSMHPSNHYSSIFKIDGTNYFFQLQWLNHYSLIMQVTLAWYFIHANICELSTCCMVMQSRDLEIHSGCQLDDSSLQTPKPDNVDCLCFNTDIQPSFLTIRLNRFINSWKISFASIWRWVLRAVACLVFLLFLASGIASRLLTN